MVGCVCWDMGVHVFVCVRERMRIRESARGGLGDTEKDGDCDCKDCKDCSWQDGDLGEPVVWFQPKCEGLRTRRSLGISSSLSPCLTAED